MGVALASSLHLRTLNISVGKRSVFQSRTKLKLKLKLMYISTSNLAGEQLSSRKPILLVASATNQHHTRLQETENRKYDLLKAIQDTQRGLVTTADQRSSIEEALVCVEGYDAGSFIDLGQLNGTWRLQYTSAPDVLLLLDSAAKLPFFQVGQIFQKFECQGQNNGGYVRNVVSWSIPNLLEEQEGATLLVSAKFSVVSLRNIYLQFEEITIKNIYISEVLQALIAPAILPRSFLSLQISTWILDPADIQQFGLFRSIVLKISAIIGCVVLLLLLQSIRAFEAQFPVINTGRQPVGGLYYLSYLDDNMLLGRAVASGGAHMQAHMQAHSGSTGTVSSDNDHMVNPVAAAEEIAFCRACARFGLGLYLYHEE